MTITGCVGMTTATWGGASAEVCLAADRGGPATIDGQSDAAPVVAALALRGDPTFDPSELGAEERRAYDGIKRLLAARPGGLYDPYVMADSDDIWWMGHGLQTHVQAVLVAFRITGDLTLLDHVDELAELMRSNLADAWRDTEDRTDGTTDGFLNWAHRTVTSEDTQGKDVRIEYDQKAHALVAQLAYALHANRDLTSPAGYDYAGHADFWRGYLVDHFEAKMRSRHGTTDGSFPIVDWPPTISSYADWAKWHYYMGELTGDAGYTNEAKRMSDVLLGQLRTVSTPHGDAYVWRRSNPDHPAGAATYLAPTTYSDFVFSDAVEFHLEGFHFWADPVHMQRLALTLTQLIMDEPDAIRDGMAADVGGERARCGIRSRAGFRRVTPELFATMTFTLVAPWDTTDTIPSLATEMHEYNASRDVDTTRILAGLMLDAHLQADPSGTTRAARAP